MADKVIYHDSPYGWGYPVIGVGPSAQATYFDHRTGWYKNMYGANICKVTKPIQSTDGTMHMPVNVEFLEESGLWPVK